MSKLNATARTNTYTTNLLNKILRYMINGEHQYVCYSEIRKNSDPQRTNQNDRCLLRKLDKMIESLDGVLRSFKLSPLKAPFKFKQPSSNKIILSRPKWLGG